MPKNMGRYRWLLQKASWGISCGLSTSNFCIPTLPRGRFIISMEHPVSHCNLLVDWRAGRGAKMHTQECWAAMGKKDVNRMTGCTCLWIYEYEQMGLHILLGKNGRKISSTTRSGQGGRGPGHWWRWGDTRMKSRGSWKECSYRLWLYRAGEGAKEESQWGAPPNPTTTKSRWEAHLPAFSSSLNMVLSITCQWIREEAWLGDTFLMA